MTNKSTMTTLPHRAKRLAIRSAMFGATCAAALTFASVAQAHDKANSDIKIDAAAFATWLDGVREEARNKGLDTKIVMGALTGIKPITRVIELDNRQPEFTLTFKQYMDRVVPQSRVNKGRQKLAENRAALEKVAKAYGVQARFIVAFWGIETDFGRVTGGFKVIPALATLAHDGRRSSYFRKELFNALNILNEGHITADAMVGSWAGAMGQCQFMPSSFRNFARDGDGDGRIDIWGSKSDVFESAANYLAKSGWKGDQTWGRQVQLPDGFDRSLANLKTKKRLSEWQAAGIRRADGADLPKRDLTASLVFAGADKSGNGGVPYLVYNNYRTILKWNRSTFFAVAVGTLADRIGGR